MLTIKVRGVPDESGILDFISRTIRRRLEARLHTGSSVCIVVEPANGSDALTRCAISASADDVRLHRVESVDRNALTAISLAVALLISGVEADGSSIAAAPFESGPSDRALLEESD